MMEFLQSSCGRMRGDVLQCLLGVVELPLLGLSGLLGDVTVIFS